MGLAIRALLGAVAVMAAAPAGAVTLQLAVGAGDGSSRVQGYQQYLGRAARGGATVGVSQITHMPSSMIAAGLAFLYV